MTIPADTYIIQGRKAFCRERNGTVTVKYENGSFTAASPDTFRHWLLWPPSDAASVARAAHTTSQRAEK